MSLPCNKTSWLTDVSKSDEAGSKSSYGRVISYGRVWTSLSRRLSKRRTPRRIALRTTTGERSNGEYHAGTTADRTACNDGRAKNGGYYFGADGRKIMKFVCVQNDTTRNGHNTVRAVLLAQTAARYEIRVCAERHNTKRTRHCPGGAFGANGRKV
ncbi:unnamed protein product [Macrosiphum euphorbiae]|uniref:Uncharacterized protein n=1 Tax=Macrosiphum euphorbiae TaxID=13131 RepID=A0AAV0W052_9HEMI|nr:unnamed protein product [Macrosiphum euphorbiae]